MTDRAFLDPSLLAFVGDVLGTPAIAVRDLSGTSRAPSVLEIRLANGGRAVLKLHDAADKHRREAIAYRAWGPWLVPELPRLLAVRDAPPRAILLEALPGRPAPGAEGRVAAAPDGAAPDDAAADDAAAAAQLRSIHEAAGAWLARLHRLPPDAAGADPLPLDEAYRQRADAALRQASTVLGRSTRRSVEALLAEAVPMLAERPRVPCHRDFTPQNWLVDGGRWIAAVDLEHARADLAEADLARLASRVWAVRPDLRAAFVAGYRAVGGPADPDAPWLPGVRALDAVGAIGWAARHDDAALAVEGRAALATALDAAR